MKPLKYQSLSRTALRQLFLLALLLPVGAWAQYEFTGSPYNLWIRGTAVTEDNKSNILSDNGATVSYDSENNILTLNNASIEGAYSTNGCIVSGRSSLTISILGENTISTTDTDSCTAILSIKEGSQPLTIVKGGDDCSLTFQTARSIRNFSSLSLTGLYWNDTFSYEYVIASDYVGGGYQLLFSDGNEAGSDEPTPVLSDAQPYDLRVGGTIVTDKNASNIFGGDYPTAVYDNDTHTLTLNAIHYSGETEAFINIGSSIDELTVFLVGRSEIGYGAGYVFSAVEECQVNIVTNAAVPGNLEYYGDNVYNEETVMLNFADSGLTLNGTAIEPIDGTDNISYFGTGQFHDGTDGVSGDDNFPYWDYSNSMWYYNSAVTTDHNSNLPPTVVSMETNDGYISSMRTNGNDVMKSLIFQCVPVENNAAVLLTVKSLDGETTYASGTIEDGCVELAFQNGAAYDDIVFVFTSQSPFSFVPMTFNAEMAETYGLEITGSDVTEFNLDDVFGDGTVSYNINTNTLTLKNATIISEREAPAINYSSEGELKIMLVGNNTVQGAGGCEGIRVDSEEGSVIFTTDEENPGSLVCNGENPLYDENESDKFNFGNGLALSTTATGQMVGYFASYDLWVLGNRVTSVNKENITGDANASVRYNAKTNTLSLYGASLGDEYTDTIFSSALPELTVELRGNNSLQFNLAAFKSRNATSMSSLTFTTSSTTPGQLSWTTSAGAFVEGFEVTCTEPLRSFETCQTEQLISVATAEDYDLAIGTTTVSSVNCTDVLGDGNVKYVAADNTLVLQGATLTEPITSSLADGLTIYLLGENTISVAENLIVSTVADAPLTFTTSDTDPGSLTLTKTLDAGEWISDFDTPTIPAGYATTIDSYNSNIKYIARVVPITPIVSESENGEQPSVEVETAYLQYSIPSGAPEDTQLNVVVNNVLYTLKAGDYNEGTNGDDEDPAGINLTEVPADMSDVLSKTPGTDAYAAAFKGLTIEIPAGTGVITVTGEVGEGAKLGVKIGNNEPILFPNEQFSVVDLSTPLTIPYNCSEPTYVYVYLAQAASTSRAGGPIHAKVLGGHVKVTSIGAASSVMVNSNSYSAQNNSVAEKVVAYEVPASAVTADNSGIVLSTVEVTPAAARAGGPRLTSTQKPITELSASVFDKIAKADIRYIDLSGTALTDVTVSREGGVFKGFGNNVVIYLPERNDDGGENNVVINGECAMLSVTDAAGFRARTTFSAAQAEIDRTFVADQTSTVFLPFALTKAQADALGTFHTFKEIKDGDAVFNAAEADGTTANTPYIFVPKATKIEATSVSVVGLDATSVTNGNMTGTFEKVIWDAEQADVYGFAATSGTSTGGGTVSAGQFVRVDAGAWVAPFRAYLKVPATARQLNVVIEGDEAITSVNEELRVKNGESADAIYNLSGQRVDKLKRSAEGRLFPQGLKKGLYIINGRKVVK